MWRDFACRNEREITDQKFKGDPVTSTCDQRANRVGHAGDPTFPAGKRAQFRPKGLRDKY